MPRRRSAPRRAVTTPTAGAGAGAPRAIRPMAVVAALGAIVTLVSSVLGLVFLLLPSLKPDPPAPPPAHTAVHLRRVSFDPHVSFGQSLRRQGIPSRDLDRATLAQAGALLTVHLTIIGYKGAHLPLRWQLLDVDAGRQMGQEQAITITAVSQEDEGDWLVWAPTPRRPGRYAIEVALLPPKGVAPLATFRGPRFAIGA